MKVICDRIALNEALSVATAVVPSRSPKPILQCVRLTAAKDGLTVTAYDQDVGLRYHVSEVEVDKTGETLVPADRLAAIVRESSDETMSLEAAGSELVHVRGQDSHFQIYGQDVREFPPVPDFEGDPDFRVSLAEAVAGTERTMFAAAREATRYALNGVLWERKGKRVQFVATDGRRLACTGIAVEKGDGGDSRAIVPLKTLMLLTKLRRADDDGLDVKVHPNQVMMKAPRAVICSVLVEGNFPNYEEVIPRDCDRVVELETAQFLSGVRRAALLTTEESRGVKLSFSADALTLSSRVAEQGEATIKVDARYKGAPLDVGFNPVFLIDALKICGESVTLEMKDPTKPSIMRSGQDFIYVVMPVSLS